MLFRVLKGNNIVNLSKNEEDIVETCLLTYVFLIHSAFITTLYNKGKKSKQKINHFYKFKRTNSYNLVLDCVISMNTTI